LTLFFKIDVEWGNILNNNKRWTKKTPKTMNNMLILFDFQKNNLSIYETRLNASYIYNLTSAVYQTKTRVIM